MDSKACMHCKDCLHCMEWHPQATCPPHAATCAPACLHDCMQRGRRVCCVHTCEDATLPIHMALRH
eukprot:365940-Chlamydomonas_euryale.AAC.8